MRRRLNLFEELAHAALRQSPNELLHGLTIAECNDRRKRTDLSHMPRKINERMKNGKFINRHHAYQHGHRLHMNGGMGEPRTWYFCASAPCTSVSTVTRSIGRSEPVFISTSPASLSRTGESTLQGPHQLRHIPPISKKKTTTRKNALGEKINEHYELICFCSGRDFSKGLVRLRVSKAKHGGTGNGE